MHPLQRPFRPPSFCHRHIATLVAPHRLNLLTLLRFAAKAAPAMPVTVSSTLLLHTSYQSHHRVSRSMPVNMPHMVYLLKRHRCDLVYVQLSHSRSHSHMSVPPMWDQILCAELLPTREVQVPPLREPTILSVHLHGLVLFLNHEPLFFLWSNLVNPNLTGSVTLIQLTAISCIINTVSLFFSGIQGRRAETPPISLRRPVEGSMQLFFKKPVIMFRTSLISSLHTLATQTSPSCSTRTPLSPILWFSPSKKIPQAKVRRAWYHSSFEETLIDKFLPSGHVIPSLMSTTQSPDTDSLFSSTPLLRAQLAQLQSTLSQQMNKPSFQLKPLGAALRLKTTQKKQVSTIQRNIHKQLYNSLTDTPTERAILLSQSTSHTGAHLMQPRSEAAKHVD